MSREGRILPSRGGPLTSVESVVLGRTRSWGSTSLKGYLSVQLMSFTYKVQWNLMPAEPPRLVAGVPVFFGGDAAKKSLAQ